MNIKSITTNVAGKVKKVVKPKVETVRKIATDSSKSFMTKSEKLTNSLNDMATNAKAGLAVKKSKLSHFIDVTKENHELAPRAKQRFNSLVSDSLSHGVSKKEAKQSAEVLIAHTGIFSHKIAADSAKTFEPDASSKDLIQSLKQLQLKKKLESKFIDRLKK